MRQLLLSDQCFTDLLLMLKKLSENGNEIKTANYMLLVKLQVSLAVKAKCSKKIQKSNTYLTI